MTKIDADRAEMRQLFSKTQAVIDDQQETLDDMPGGCDGGVAASKMTFILRAVMESSQRATELAAGVVTIASHALQEQFKTEEEILDDLNNFSKRAFG